MTSPTPLKLLLALALGLAGLFTAPAARAQTSLIQNAPGRRVLSLNGSWNYIIDPYENGFYDYRREAFDKSASGKGGYYDNAKPSTAQEPELIEYDFDHSAAMQIPGGVADSARRAGGEARVVQQQLVIRALRTLRPPQYSRPADGGR